MAAMRRGRSVTAGCVLPYRFAEKILATRSRARCSASESRPLAQAMARVSSTLVDGVERVVV